ncbi:hypothetical protein [Bradyrhizobium sp. sBnM-33]|jgi:hypothetical protein|uniref:hypothetical protein n=1 Tax=Bradyrhizobium sp. sBnM-33 TaxID=2831780 RepID=UPI001BCF77FD|nr:hypothetical protein [Bradyrhizobium sp. sBnM-33]WOH54093.1 hypothetical protein RX328_19520 [Bradyrhizobium sp. sBnM-33]
MLMLSLFRFVTAMIPWVRNLVTWLVARSLNMPEPLVHDTGVFVFMQVRTIENKVGKAICPVRLMRQLRSLLQH